MKLFRRTRRLVSATVHDLYDRLEQPESAARQSLRDLEQTIDAARASTARSIAAERLLAQTHDGYVQRAGAWDAHARDAVRAGEEELARRALARKFELNRLAVHQHERLNEIRSTNQRLRAQLEAMTRQYAEARDRLLVDSARRAAATAVREVQVASSGLVAAPHHLADLDNDLARVERLAVEAEAHAELTVDEDVLSHQERDTFIAAELDRLRTEARQV